MDSDGKVVDDHFADEDSLTDDSDNTYLGLDYSNLPVPKMPRKYCNSFDLFALDETIAKHRAKQHQSLDHCLQETMEQSGELRPLSRIIRDHRRQSPKRAKPSDKSARDPLPLSG